MAAVALATCSSPTLISWFAQRTPTSYSAGRITSMTVASSSAPSSRTASTTRHAASRFPARIAKRNLTRERAKLVSIRTSFSRMLAHRRETRKTRRRSVVAGGVVGARRAAARRAPQRAHGAGRDVERGTGALEHVRLEVQEIRGLLERGRCRREGLRLRSQHGGRIARQLVHGPQRLGGGLGVRLDPPPAARPRGGGIPPPPRRAW